MQTTTHYLQTTVPVRLDALTADAPRRWGRMTPQHAVEHLAGVLRISNGKAEVPLAVPPEHLPKALVFLRSDRTFRPETKAPLLPAEPLPLRFPDIAEAKRRLRREVDDFYAYHEAHPDARPMHPAFGPLDRADWERFHAKHFAHHFRQFGLEE
ncbi:MAG: DUF1569 domain-containing protein [Catalinimonas sp.]